MCDPQRYANGNANVKLLVSSAQIHNHRTVIAHESRSRPDIGQNILGRQVAVAGVSPLTQNKPKISSECAVDCEVKEEVGEQDGSTRPSGGRQPAMRPHPNNTRFENRTLRLAHNAYGSTRQSANVLRKSNSDDRRECGCGCGQTRDSCTVLAPGSPDEPRLRVIERFINASRGRFGNSKPTTNE